MNSFAGLDLAPALQQAVAALGYAGMTAIQAATLPQLLAGRDVIAQARTGSGKTAAFGLALLQQLAGGPVQPQCLVLCPTRELADQVSKEIRALARFVPNVKVLSLCGGVPVRTQLASLAHAPHIVVGTPGRIEDLVEKGALALDGVQQVVLDEADRMLDMGFLEAIERILGKTPAQRSTWLFSATYPAEIRAISARFQRDPVAVTAAAEHEEGVIEQRFYRVEPVARVDAVLALLQAHQPSSCLVFCNTRLDTKELADTLWKRGVPALALHGELEQRERDEALLQFANGSARVLVATDVAARGLDIKALPMVIACALANDADVHVHRAGRTGRAGETGVVHNLVCSAETVRLGAFERVLGAPLAWAALPQAGRDATLAPPAMQTLMIEAGRQDKLRPGDILGALTGDAGLPAARIGKIDVTATRAYVAIERGAIDKALAALRGGRIKGRNFRVRKL